MTGTAKERSVYRYFDIADCFVQIMALDEAGLALAERPGLGRAGYRKLVIEACMPEFRDKLECTLERLFPDDPLMVEDLLYQLCVEVNPGLDINEVRLTVDPSVTSDAEADANKMRDQVAESRDELLNRLSVHANGLGAIMRSELMGQDAAVDAVARAVRSAAAGLGEPQKPLGSFLFTGRTGTGKTELARSLAKHLFGSTTAKGLVRIDCSEYAMAHEYSKLIGSPPGYIGHDDGGQLTDAIAENPESIVLFDEIEKAHPKLHNLLLQVLEEGALTDGKGRRVSFERSLVIMTSNCGANEMQTASRSVGFGGSPALNKGSLEDITRNALECTFSPEFLGRIGDVILFNELSVNVVERIASKKLNELRERAATRGLTVRFTPAVARWVAHHSYRPECGARELRRVIAKELEPRLSDLLLHMDRSGVAIVRVRAGELIFDTQKAAA